MSPSPCRFCGAACRSFARATVLGRHDAHYLRCGSCGSVHVEQPGWLDEAYIEAIARTDIGLPSRAVWSSQMTAMVIRLFFRRARSFCDHGGGDGLFVRLMRDAGYDFCWRDRYAHNQFARGFEAQAGDRFDLVTAFEVLEHLEGPHELVSQVVAEAPALLLTTELLPDDAPKPDQWWYYSLATGQHISFATRRGIQALAEAHDLAVTSAGSVHLLAPEPVPARVLRLVTARRVARLGAGWSSRPSLLPEDYDAAVAELIARRGAAR